MHRDNQDNIIQTDTPVKGWTSSCCHCNNRISGRFTPLQNSTEFKVKKVLADKFAVWSLVIACTTKVTF